MSRTSHVMALLIALGLATGCATPQGRVDEGPSLEELLESGPFVITAPRSNCAEAKREARMSETPMRVICGSRLERATFIRGGRPGGTQGGPPRPGG